MQAHQQETNLNILSLLPDELLTLILRYLPDTNKRQLRAANQQLKNRMELKRTWDDKTVGDDEIIDMFVMSLPGLLRDMKSKLDDTDSIEECEHIIQQVVEIKKIVAENKDKRASISRLLSDINGKARPVIEKLVREERENNMITGCNINSYCTCVTLLASLTMLLFIYLPPNDTPESMAELCAQSPRQCIYADFINTTLRLTMATYFLVGGSAGFLLKAIDACLLAPRTLENSLPHLLPVYNYAYSFKEKCQRLAWQVFEGRDYIAFGLSTILSSIMIRLNLSELISESKIKNYLYWGVITPDNQERLASDIASRSRSISGFSSADGLLLTYSLMGMCFLGYRATKKLAYNCHAFFHKDKTLDPQHMDEQTKLLSPSMTRGSDNC